VSISEKALLDSKWIPGEVCAGAAHQPDEPHTSRRACASRHRARPAARGEPPLPRSESVKPNCTQYGWLHLRTGYPRASTISSSSLIAGSSYLHHTRCTPHCEKSARMQGRLCRHCVCRGPFTQSAQIRHRAARAMPPASAARCVHACAIAGCAAARRRTLTTMRGAPSVLCTAKVGSTAHGRHTSGIRARRSTRARPRTALPRPRGDADHRVKRRRLRHTS
jgi:hypothetical protein